MLEHADNLMNHTLPIDDSNKIKQLVDDDSIVKLLHEHEDKSLIKEENMVGSPWFDVKDKLNTTQSSVNSPAFRNTQILSKIISENNLSKSDES